MIPAMLLVMLLRYEHYSLAGPRGGIGLRPRDDSASAGAGGPGRRRRRAGPPSGGHHRHQRSHPAQRPDGCPGAARGLVVPGHGPLPVGPAPRQPDRAAHGRARVQLARRGAVGVERARRLHRGDPVQLAPVRDPHPSAVRVPGRAAAHQVGSPLRRARLPDHDGVAADRGGLLRPGGRRRLPAVPEQPAPDLGRPGRIRHRQRDLECARGGRPGRADLASRAPVARGRRPGRAPPRRAGLVGRRGDGRAGARPARDEPRPRGGQLRRLDVRRGPARARHPPLRVLAGRPALAPVGGGRGGRREPPPRRGAAAAP